jgi:hypothetical protein
MSQSIHCHTFVQLKVTSVELILGGYVPFVLPVARRAYLKLQYVLT